MTGLMTERRYNALTREWIVVSTNRQDRVYKPPADECPLCPLHGDHGKFTEVPIPTFEVAVFENRFPSMSPSFDVELNESSGGFMYSPAYGHCEVIVYSDDHDVTFAGLPFESIRLLVDVWTDRWHTLGSDPQIQYVMPFENKGELVGATLSHSHGQIYAFTDLPSLVEKEVSAARGYFNSTQQCLQCDTNTMELESKQRIVVENDSWLVGVPFAPHFPYEVHIVPKRHVPSLPNLLTRERDELASVLSIVTKSYDRLWDFSLPYVMAIHQRPTDDDCVWNECCHLRFEFKPFHRSANKVKFLAGSELEAGAFVVDVSPEIAASELREALPW